jgi:hypothetical protein
MKRVDIRGLGWADIKSNESKKMPQAPTMGLESSPRDCSSAIRKVLPWSTTAECAREQGAPDGQP